jgi:predicted porin
MNIKFILVAAASVAATALPAQTSFTVGAATNVTIGGLFTAGIKNSEVTNTSRPGVKSEWRIDDNTSRLIISSNSKIAEGWSVIFRIESRFLVDVRPTTAGVPGTTITSGQITGWADGDTWGGVATPIGSIVYGKSSFYWTDTISFDYLGIPAAGEAYRIWDANGLATFNMLDQATLVNPATGKATTSAYTLGNTREQNVLRFDSAKFYNFDVSLAYTKNDGGDENHYVAPGTVGYARAYEDGGTFYARARYTDGGFNASFNVLNKVTQGGVYTPAATAGPLDYHAYRLGAAYIFPFKLRVGVVYDKTSYDNGILGRTQDAKRNVYEVPVSYSFGDHAVYATYTKAGDTSGWANTGASQLNLVYDYAMTKRAFIGIFYSAISNQSNAHYAPFLAGTSLGPSNIAAPGENFHQVGLNMNYWF